MNKDIQMIKNDFDVRSGYSKQQSSAHFYMLSRSGRSDGANSFRGGRSKKSSHQQFKNIPSQFSLNSNRVDGCNILIDRALKKNASQDEVIINKERGGSKGSREMVSDLVI